MSLNKELFRSLGKVISQQCPETPTNVDENDGGRTDVPVTAGAAGGGGG